jgi:hypothetical protein
MAKSNSEKSENRPKFKRLGEPEIWQSGQKVSEAQELERDDGTKGISIKIGKKVDYLGRPRYGKTIWIDEELDLPSWLDWFLNTIKKMYLRLFGKKIVGFEGREEFYKAKIALLNEQLAAAQEGMKIAEAEKIENRNLVELAGKMKENSEKLEAKFKEFKGLIQNSIMQDNGMEEEIKQMIKENPWLLGIECAVEAKNQNVDTQTQIDLHVKTKYNQDRIFELKSPNIRPFVRRNNKETRRLVIASELSEALSELILYLERTNIYSNQESEGTYGITKPSGYIIMGYHLTNEEQRMLKYLNFNLEPHIQILTYDNLEANTERELGIIVQTLKAPSELTK